MSQINVNQPPRETTVVEGGNDRTGAATINLLAVLIVVAVIAVLAWYLFTGPLHALTTGAAPSSSSPTINVNPPAPNVNVNPPASAPNSSAPAGGASNSAPAGGSTNP